MGEFKVVLRHGGNDFSGKNYVSIRKDAISISARLKREADLDSYKYVTLYIDEEDMRIGLHFHNNVDDVNCYNLGIDGGSQKRGKARSGNTLAIQARRLIQSIDWLKKISQEKDSYTRRFEAQWDGRKKLWVINCRPNFENTVTDIQDIPTTAYGIYRYKLKGEIQYIGRGHIRDRALSPERTDWEWDEIEFSLLDDEPSAMYWENWWLDNFKYRNNRRPQYNSISGYVKPKPEEEEA